MNDKIKVAVLLATYNGEKYISELLDSLLKQTYDDFYLFVSDDFSSDSTIEKIKLYENRFKNRITYLDKKQNSKSACKNFLFMLANIESDVYLFCDQDDVWTENHIARLIDEYQKNKNNSIPILIHSDLVVVREDLSVIDESFFHYSKIPRYQNKNLYFFQNNVTGCACLINNELKELMFSDKVSFFSNIDKIPMHDSLVALMASYFGSIIHIPETLIFYRQHQNNVVGAQKVGSLRYIKNKLFSQKQSSLNKDYILFFYEQYKNLMAEKDILFFNDFIQIFSKNQIQKDFFYIKNHLLKTGIFRIMKQLILG